MIEVQNLVKCYGKARVLNNINFKVNEGEILGFLGPNGAGKSTTMNIITGFLALSSGNVKVAGIDIFKKPIKAKQKIGYLPETPALYQDMTVKAYLNFVFDLKKIKLNKEEHIQEICKTVGIDEVQNRVIKNLSKGYKQRVGLAQALVGYPEVLILDEPTVGLDPKQIIEIRNLIKSLSKKHTVILSSHILPEVQAICDRILVINKGKIVADDTPDKLAENVSGENKLRVTIDGNEEDAILAIKSIQEVIDVQKVETKDEKTCTFDVTCSKDADIKKQLAMAVNKTGAILLSANNIQMSLEDIFLKLTEESQETTDEDQNTNVNEENKLSEDTKMEETDKTDIFDKEKAQEAKETTEIKKEEINEQPDVSKSANDNEENKLDKDIKIEKNDAISKVAKEDKKQKEQKIAKAKTKKSSTAEKTKEPIKKTTKTTKDTKKKTSTNKAKEEKIKQDKEKPKTTKAKTTQKKQTASKTQKDKETKTKKVKSTPKKQTKAKTSKGEEKKEGENK